MQRIRRFGHAYHFLLTGTVIEVARQIVSAGSHKL